MSLSILWSVTQSNVFKQHYCSLLMWPTFYSIQCLTWHNLCAFSPCLSFMLFRKLFHCSVDELYDHYFRWKNCQWFWTENFKISRESREEKNELNSEKKRNLCQFTNLGCVDRVRFFSVEFSFHWIGQTLTLSNHNSGEVSEETKKK